MARPWTIGIIGDWWKDKRVKSVGQNRVENDWDCSQTNFRWRIAKAKLSIGSLEAQWRGGNRSTDQDSPFAFLCRGGREQRA